MSAEKSLMAAYGEWHRLAMAEGRAIRLRRWSFLLECQTIIKKLQPRITQLAREVREEWKSSAVDIAAKEFFFNDVVARLIGLVRHNQSLLAAAQKTARVKRAEREQARLNLKRLQQSYVLGCPPAWTSRS